MTLLPMVADVAGADEDGRVERGRAVAGRGRKQWEP